MPRLNMPLLDKKIRSIAEDTLRGMDPNISFNFKHYVRDVVLDVVGLRAGTVLRTLGIRENPDGTWAVEDHETFRSSRVGKFLQDTMEAEILKRLKKLDFVQLAPRIDRLVKDAISNYMRHGMWHIADHAVRDALDPMVQERVQRIILEQIPDSAQKTPEQGDVAVPVIKPRKGHRGSKKAAGWTGGWTRRVRDPLGAVWLREPRAGWVRLLNDIPEPGISIGDIEMLVNIAENEWQFMKP